MRIVDFVEAVTSCGGGAAPFSDPHPATSVDFEVIFRTAMPSERLMCL